MKERLSRENWLDHGLKVLAVSGYEHLKADPLARSLGVSRGSFYWHFTDIEHYHRELASRWRQRTTDEVISQIENQAGNPGDRLNLLLRTAMQINSGLERSVRVWATQHAAALEAVADVDRVRIAYITDLLENHGIPIKQAQSRAIMLYWAYLGRIMMGNSSPVLDIEEMDSIAELFKRE